MWGQSLESESLEGQSPKAQSYGDQSPDQSYAPM